MAWKIAESLPSTTMPATTKARPSQLQRLFAARPIERIEANRVLYRGDSESGFLFEIARGCVRHFTMCRDGRRSIVAFSFEGDYCGDPLERANIFSAEAITQLEVRRISGAQLRAAVANLPELEGELLALACRELESAQTHCVVLRSNSALAKVASFLVSSESRLASGDAPQRVIQLPMSRLDVADFLGLTIESVSRAFTQLKMCGYISVTGRNQIVIGEISALRKLADAYPLEALVPHSSRAHNMIELKPARVGRLSTEQSDPRTTH